jgi:hypothetical protein
VSQEQLRRLNRSELKEYAKRLQQASIAVAEPTTISDAANNLRELWDISKRSPPAEPEPAVGAAGADDEMYFPPGTSVHIDRNGNIEVHGQTTSPTVSAEKKKPITPPPTTSSSNTVASSPSRAYVSPLRHTSPLSASPAVHVNRHGSVQIGRSAAPALSPHLQAVQLKASNERLGRMVEMAEKETRKLAEYVGTPPGFGAVNSNSRRTVSPATKSVSPSYSFSDDYAAEMERIKKDALSAGLEVWRSLSATASPSASTFNSQTPLRSSPNTVATHKPLQDTTTSTPRVHIGRRGSIDIEYRQ